MHFDGRPSPLRTGPGSAVLRSLRRGSSPVSDAGLRHSVGRALDRGPRPQRLIRDALFLLHTGGVDLLHDECRGCVRPAPQIPACCQALQDVGIPLHSGALLGGFCLVYGECLPRAAMAVIHGLGDCRHRSPGVLDLAQAGTSSVSLPCAPSELTYGVENPRL